MYSTVQKKDLDYIQPEKYKRGDLILYCPNHDFKVENSIMKPICPNCGKRLMVVPID